MTRLTARGAVVLAVAVFTLGVLLASWLGRPAVAGVFFLAGGTAAACWVRKSDLLLAAVSPPTLLCIVLVVVSAVTGSGGLAVSAAEGTALTLAGAAPWLFAGTALPLTIAAARGLLGPAWPLRQQPSRPAGPSAVRRGDAGPAAVRRGDAGPAAVRRGDAADGGTGPDQKQPDATRV